ncbi:MAG: hypothetical protein QXO51_07970 [Halobacteria archaeon]
MRATSRCGHCGELLAGSFNSLCVTCFSRSESALHIAKLPSSGGAVRGG